MSKNIMLKLNYTCKQIPGYADKISSDFSKAAEEWSKIKRNPKSKTVDGLVELINENKEIFLEINSTDTWEDAMVWNALLYHYDAQDGLKFENGINAQIVVDAFQKSNCSPYAKRTIEYAYNILFHC